MRAFHSRASRPKLRWHSVFNRKEMAMQRFRTALLGGIAALALGGLAGTAAAQNPNTHTLKVQLPGGGVAEIRYTGNIPPQIVVTDAPASLAAFDPMPSMFGADSPFAMMERISA